MGLQQHVIDEPAAPWVVRPVTDPKRDVPRDAIDKYLSDGLDGRPHALLVKFPALWKNPAHFHDQPQFQIVLDGNLNISNHTVEAVAVHYTDANVAYGPLLMGPHLTFGLFRLQKAREFKLSEPDSRVLRDPHGRELSGQSKDVAWIKLSGKQEGIEQKVLTGKASEAGPKAHRLKCAPGVELQFDPRHLGSSISCWKDLP